METKIEGKGFSKLSLYVNQNNTLSIFINTLEGRATNFIELDRKQAKNLSNEILRRVSEEMRK